MKKSQIILTILLLVAMAAGVLLVKQNQEMRRGATFANTSLQILPAEKKTLAVGETFGVHVYYAADADKKIDGVQAVVCYGNELSLSEEGIVASNENGFDDLTKIVSIRNTGGNRSCATIAVTSEQAVGGLKTTGDAINLTFKAEAAGSGNITIDKANSMVTGDNSASETDKMLAITNDSSKEYEVQGEVLTGNEPVLNFKVAFGNVKAGDAACVVDWPLQIIVLSGADTMVYPNVKATKLEEKDGKVIFGGSVPLAGFDHLENVAAFIKGSKHLQMKYAIQDQSGPYNKAGGELTLTRDASTSPTYDFSGYPMIPGDVTSEEEGVQDGWINGIDFAFVKNKVVTEQREPAAAGTYMHADLDGNCQYNSNDVNVLRISLQTKQGQLY